MSDTIGVVEEFLNILFKLALGSEHVSSSWEWSTHPSHTQRAVIVAMASVCRCLMEGAHLF